MSEPKRFTRHEIRMMGYVPEKKMVTILDTESILTAANACDALLWSEISYNYVHSTFGSDGTNRYVVSVEAKVVPLAEETIKLKKA